MNDLLAALDGMNDVLVAVGCVLLGAALVWLLSRIFLHFRPRSEREQVIRLEVRARTLHEHVHHAEGEGPYTAEEVGDVLFGDEKDEKDVGEPKEGGASED